MMHAAKQDWPDVAAVRVLCRSHQQCRDQRRLVFIDETALNTKMARMYGRERCLGKMPHGHRQTSTFIAALRFDRIDAPFLNEGSAIFKAQARWVRVERLPVYSPGVNPVKDLWSYW